MMWKKYKAIATKSFLRSIEYRAEIFIWVLLSIIPTGIILLVWTSIYGQTGEINNFSLVKIIQYYLLAMIINRLTSSHFEDRTSRNIREGRIDHLLTKPVSYPKQLFFKTLGGRLSSTTFASPILFILIILSIYTGSNIQNFWTFTTFSILLVCTYLIEWLFAFITVLFSFWYENASGLQHFKWLLITILSGSMIPIPFMPPWLKNLVNQLPLKYLYSVPIAVVQDNYLLSSADWLYLTSFIGALLIVSKIIWKKGEMKYTSAGG